MGIETKLPQFDKDKVDNKLINSNFKYWQYYGPATQISFANGTLFTADRFIHRCTVNSMNVERRTDGDDFTCWVAKQDFGAATLFQMGQAVEYSVFKDLLGKEVTFSLYARANNANAVSLSNRFTVYFRNDVEDGDIKFGANLTSFQNFDQAITTGFVRYDFQFTIPADAKAMFLQFGSPSTDDYNAGDGFETKNWMLHEGNEPIDFKLRGRDENEELILCQRYFCKSYNIEDGQGTITSEGQVFSTVSSADSHRMNTRFPVTMRGIPVVTLFNPTTGAVGARNDTTNANITPTPTYIGQNGYGLGGGSSFGAPGNQIKQHYIANAEL